MSARPYAAAVELTVKSETGEPILVPLARFTLLYARNGGHKSAVVDALKLCVSAAVDEEPARGFGTIRDGKTIIKRATPQADGKDRSVDAKMWLLDEDGAELLELNSVTCVKPSASYYLCERNGAVQDAEHVIDDVRILKGRLPAGKDKGEPSPSLPIRCIRETFAKGSAGAASDFLSLSAMLSGREATDASGALSVVRGMLSPASVIPTFDALVAAKKIRIGADDDISDALGKIEKIAKELNTACKPKDIEAEIQNLRVELAGLGGGSVESERELVAKLEAELEATVVEEAAAAATAKVEAAADDRVERAASVVAAAGRTAAAANVEARKAKIDAAQAKIDAAQAKINLYDAAVCRLEARYQELDAQCKNEYKTRNDADKARDLWDKELKTLEAALQQANAALKTAADGAGPVAESAVPPEIVAAARLLLRYTREHPEDGVYYSVDCGADMTEEELVAAEEAFEKIAAAAGPDLTAFDLAVTDAEEALADGQAEREGWAKDAAQAATAYAVGSRERATVIEEQEAAEKALKAAREELRQAAIERSKLQAEDDA